MRSVTPVIKDARPVVLDVGGKKNRRKEEDGGMGNY